MSNQELIQPAEDLQALIDRGSEGNERLNVFFRDSNGALAALLIEPVSIVRPSSDSDGDGILDDADNCVDVANPNQHDFDQDGSGDACDADDDDGVADSEDAFPFDPTETSDSDGDGTGDNADTDDDNDGQADTDEVACGSDPFDPSSTSPDFDENQTPDRVDTDDDNDLVLDGEDLCPMTSLYDFSSESDVGINRYALVGDTVFDTNTAQNDGAVYTTEHTGGCNAMQIADALELGKSHYEKGITRSVLESWIAGLNS